MPRLETSEARKNFADTVNRVVYGGERIVLRRRRKDLIAMVPLADLELLEEIEDYLDSEDAEGVLRRVKGGQEQRIPWAEVKRFVRGKTKRSSGRKR